MKRYEQGSQCTFTKDSKEYQNIQEFCNLLNELSPNRHFYCIKNVYLDAGQNWMWTTIVDETADCQVLSPKEWFDIVNRDYDYNKIAQEFFKDKYCQDKKRED